MATPDALLPEADVLAALESLPGWSLSQAVLRKEFAFDQYARGALFALAVAHVAEGMDHHPDVLLIYGKVAVATSTHSAGGVTSLDLELARRIEALA